MRAPVPGSAADLAEPAAWRRAKSPFVIDIGANIGWFAINAAAAGGTVAAFEGAAWLWVGWSAAGSVQLRRLRACLHFKMVVWPT